MIYERLKHIITLLALIVGMTANAQLLYKVIVPNSTKVSYILATHHAVPVSALNNIDGVFRCYNDCDAVVGEICLNEDSVATRMAVEAQMQTNIADLLDKEDYKLLDSTLNAIVKVRLADVAHLRPIMIENIIFLTLFEEIFPRGEDDTQMDSFFQQIAVQQGKPIFGLETIDEQLKLLFHSNTIQQQTQDLLTSVRKLPQLSADLKRLNKLYIDGNLDSIFYWTKEMENMNPDDYERMIVERNTRWVNVLTGLLDKHSCFIVVGALHLPGEDGLLALLSKKGYKVKPI